MDVDTLFLVLGTRPQKRRVRPPDLNAPGVFRLLDVQCLSGRRDLVIPKAAGITDTHDRIADPGHLVVEVLPAAGAQMPAVRVNAEPILVKVRPAAMSAGHVA